MTLPGNGLVAQFGVSVPYRLIGFALVVAVALGLLWVAVRETDTSTPVYEDDEEEESSTVYSPGPAYGVGSTGDVADVLDLDEDDERTARSASGRDDGSASAPGGTASASGDGRPRAPGPAEDSGRPDTADDGFDHEYLGERSRGHLVVVTDPDGQSAEFFVRDLDAPAVEPASARDRRHGEAWVGDAKAYVREQVLSGDLRERATDWE